MDGAQDVVGINTEHKGLSVRLLRSASLLGMMHLYRFGFVVGVLQVLFRPIALSFNSCKLFQGCVASAWTLFCWDDIYCNHDILSGTINM